MIVFCADPVSGFWLPQTPGGSAGDVELRAAYEAGQLSGYWVGLAQGELKGRLELMDELLAGLRGREVLSVELVEGAKARQVH